MFIISMLAVIGMFTLLRNLLKSHWAAIIAASAFSFAPSVFYHGINPMPDVAALCSIIWGLSYLVKWRLSTSIKQVVLSALFFGIASAIKLPFILLYAAPLVLIIQLWISSEKEVSRLKSASFGLVYLLFLVPAAVWYINVIPTWHGSGIVSGLANSDDSVGELLHYAIHNTISTLPELLLNWASVILFLVGLIAIFFLGGRKNKFFIPFLITGIAVAAYYVFELNMIQDKHDYYAFPFIPFLFISVGVGARLFLTKSIVLKSLVVVCMIVAPILTFVRKNDAWNQDNELVINKQSLQAAVPSDALCILGNDKSQFIYFYHLGKKGWNFKADDLTETRIKELSDKGAEYIYSDSGVTNRYLESDLGLEKVDEIGSFCIYRINRK